MLTNQELLNRLEEEIPLLESEKVNFKIINIVKPLIACLKGEDSLKEILERFDIDRPTLKKYLDIYKKDGIEGLKMKSKTNEKEMKKELSDSLEREMPLLELEGGDSRILEIAKALVICLKGENSLKEKLERFDIDRPTLKKYLDIYKKDGIEGLKKIKLTTITITSNMKNGKKLSDFLKVEIPPLELKGGNSRIVQIAFALIDFLSGKGSQDTIAKHFNISLKTFSRYLKNYRNEIEKLKKIRFKVNLGFKVETDSIYERSSVGLSEDGENLDETTNDGNEPKNESLADIADATVKEPDSILKPIFESDSIFGNAEFFEELDLLPNRTEQTEQTEQNRADDLSALGREAIYNDDKPDKGNPIQPLPLKTDPKFIPTKEEKAANIKYFRIMSQKKNGEEVEEFTEADNELYNSYCCKLAQRDSKIKKRKAETNKRARQKAKTHEEFGSILDPKLVFTQEERDAKNKYNRVMDKRRRGEEQVEEFTEADRILYNSYSRKLIARNPERKKRKAEANKRARQKAKTHEESGSILEPIFGSDSSIFGNAEFFEELDFFPYIAEQNRADDFSELEWEAINDCNELNNESLADTADNLSALGGEAINNDNKPNKRKASQKAKTHEESGSILDPKFVITEEERDARNKYNRVMDKKRKWGRNK